VQNLVSFPEIWRLECPQHVRACRRLPWTRRTVGFFVTLAFTLLVAPLAAAPRPAQVPRIGVLLTLYAPAEYPPEAFRQWLRALGYIEGQNIVIDWRAAAGTYDQLPALAAELVRLGVDVIVADVTPATQAARQATATTPIVMMVVADPVGSGLVTSLAHPGGNITGLSILLPDISTKWLQLLTEAVPTGVRVAVLWNPATPYHKTLLTEVEAAAPSLRLHLLPIAVQGPGEFEGAFSAMARAQVGALFIADDPMFLTSRTQLIALAAQSRLPTMFAHRDFVQAGGLMSYGPSLSDMFRRAATYVDKILKGAKPADLPVEQPTQFRAGHQSQDGRGPRPDHPPIGPLPGD
jgi:putative tryptophan/tyrosine transport system substrate-binding protein